MGKYLKKIFKVVITTSILVCSISMPVTANAMTKATIAGGNYTLKNLYSNKNLNVSGSKGGNGTNINTYQSNGQKNQIYKIYKINSSYALTPTHISTDKLVNVQGDFAKSNSNVMLYSKVSGGHSTQRWIFEKVSGGYVIRSSNNSNYVLTATGKANGANVNVQLYEKGNKKQILEINPVKISSSKNDKIESSFAQKTVSEIKNQIATTYKKVRQMTGRSNFTKQCSLYVYSQLKALGIYQTPDTYWNGNQWYYNLRNNGVTKTGYTQKKYPGKYCLSNIVSANNNNNVYNIVVSFPNSYTSSKNYGSGGAGHVLFIHAIIDGQVYYSDNYRYNGIPEGGVIVKSVSEFTNYFSYHHGGPTGAIHFVK